MSREEDAVTMFSFAAILEEFLLYADSVRFYLFFKQILLSMLIISILICSVRPLCSFCLRQGIRSER